MNRQWLLAGVPAVSMIVAVVAVSKAVICARQNAELARQAAEWRRAAEADERGNARPAEAPEREPPVPSGAEEIRAGSGPDAALLAEATRLRDLLARRDEAIAEQQKKMRELEQDRVRPQGRAERRAEYMRKLQADNPQRYEELRQRRREMREQITANASDQFTFLSGIDVAGWPQEWQQNHLRLLETIRAVNEVARQTPERPESDSSEARRQMFQAIRDSREMFNAERDMLLYDMARQIGYEEADAWRFADYVALVLQMTTPRSLFQPRPQPPAAE
ncbi:MAG: hypothetical protein JXR37_32120 [Kiritimatiellae bacterium]|nr:hypothetical protein [Kiritimatiellia bacterium]